MVMARRVTGLQPKGSHMKWKNWKRTLLAFLCSGFLLQVTECPINEQTIKTAIASAGSGFVIELSKNTLKKWFDYEVGLTT